MWPAGYACSTRSTGIAPSAGSSELSTGLILRHNWQKVRDDAPAEIATGFWRNKGFRTAAIESERVTQPGCFRSGFDGLDSEQCQA